jgi:ammonia channel protein AmtB
MVPGLSLFYGGISDNRISLSMALLPYMTAAVIGIQVSKSPRQWIGGAMI